MINLTWLNIDFIRVLELVNELGRVFIALDFRQPPPTYTFNSLEPIYKQCIDHYQRLCDEKYRQITGGGPEKGDEVNVDVLSVEQQRFNELEALLQKHCLHLFFFDSFASD